jgi:hypothetical protein
MGQLRDFYNKYFWNGVIISVIFIIPFVFAMSLVGIHDASNRVYQSSNTVCPNMRALNLTRFTATKKILSQWNWRYEVNEFDSKVVQRCNTVQHDVDVFFNGDFIGRTDGKIATTVSKNYITDCHGDTLYTSRTADAFETLVNSNKIIVSYELRDNGNNVVAYADETNFFSNDINIKDINGNVVANLYRGISIPWEWTIKIYDQNADGANPLVLLAIAGKASFSDNGSKTDICNNYFWGVTWTLVAIASVLFLLLCFIAYNVSKNCWRKNKVASSIKIDQHSPLTETINVQDKRYSNV